MHEVLLVDDDQDLGRLLERYLATRGYYLRVLPDGRQLEKVLQEARPDVLVLDVMLPGKDGFALLEQVRRTRDVPVIMLTARGSESDRIRGLECGADDYLPKPFNPRELVARMEAVLRRQQGSTATPDKAIQLNDLHIDPPGRAVLIDGQRINVTSAEFDILLLLARNAGSVVSRDELALRALGHAEHAWDRTLDTHISNLRRKLGPATDGSRRITNVRGAGYVYTVSAATPA